MHIVIWLIFLFTALAEENLKSSSFYQNQLRNGVRFYKDGDRESAIHEFLSLSYAKNAPSELRQEARIYMAEILFIQEDKEGARGYFNAVLDENPNYNIDRFIHPPNVCGYFDFVKSYRASIPKEIKTPKLKAMPWVGYTPMGLYHFKYNKPQRAFFYLGTQATLAGASLYLFSDLYTDHSFDAGDTSKKELLERKVTLQRITTIGFYSLWGLSILDAQRHWQLNLAIEKKTPTISLKGNL